VTHAVPIYEGYAIAHAIQTIALSGQDLTNNLHQMLMEKNPSLIDGSAEMLKEVKLIKEKKCMVAQDFDAELKQASEN